MSLRARAASATSAASAASKVAEALALVHRPALSGDRIQRLAGDRIVAADLDSHRAGTTTTSAASAESAAVLENTLWLPGSQLADLFGKCLRVTRQLECFDGEDGRRGMVPVPAPLGREPRDDHVGLERANDTHDVGYDGGPVPDLERLDRTLRETEVDGAAEELPAAVEPAGGEQLLRPDHSQLFEDFRADDVLPAVAPSEREIGCAIGPAAGEIGDQLCVLVVGVGGHIEHASQHAKPAQLPQGVLCRHRFRGAAAGDRPGKQCPGQDEGNKPGDGPVRPVEASWCAHGEAPKLGGPSRPHCGAAMVIGGVLQSFGLTFSR